MKTINTIANIRSVITEHRLQHKKIAFVPTMGNLHEGHLSLIRKAHELADIVVVSIFVNEMQFGPSEDYSNYPRTLSDDVSKLSSEQVDYLFTPIATEMYPPTGKDTHTYITVPETSTILCGATRPGHFTWVATVVAKLFNIVRPHVAVFGEKDFQQLTIIRQMTEDLCLPVDIVGVETARDRNGLALSSRNNYLTNDEKNNALEIYKTLTHVKHQIESGNRNFDDLCQKANQHLRNTGFKPDYFAIKNRDDLSIATKNSINLVIFAAAYIGKARLIDNIQLSL